MKPLRVALMLLPDCPKPTENGDPGGFREALTVTVNI